MAKKFPDWHRPDLKERQLVGEEARLSARGLTPEQVRADLVQLLACRGGETMAQCLRAMNHATGIDPATISNFLRGRQPIYGPLIDAIYGPEPSNEVQFDELTWPEDWGPMLPDAIAAGLVSETTAPAVAKTPSVFDIESGAGGVFLTVDPAPPAAAGADQPDPDAPAASPVVATAPSPQTPAYPAPELGQGSDQGHPATPAPVSISDMISPRAPDGSGQDGEGTLREGSTIPADLVLLRDAAGSGLPRTAAGEGAPDRAAPPPPTNRIGKEPHADPCFYVLALMASRSLQAHLAVDQALDAVRKAEGELATAIEQRNRLRTAYEELERLSTEMTRPADTGVAQVAA